MLSGCNSKCRASDAAQDLQEKKRMWVTMIPVGEDFFCFDTKYLILHLCGTDTKRGCPESTPWSMVHRGGNSTGFHLFFSIFFFFFLESVRVAFVFFDTLFGARRKSQGRRAVESNYKSMHPFPIPAPSCTPPPGGAAASSRVTPGQVISPAHWWNKSHRV